MLLAIFEYVHILNYKKKKTPVRNEILITDKYTLITCEVSLKY